MEGRRTPRVKTHLVVKLTDRQTMQQYYGYVENISENGLGIASIDRIMPGSQLAMVFYLPDLKEKVIPVGSLVHTQTGFDMLNYYGFHFNYVSDCDRRAINEFIHHELHQNNEKVI